MKILFIQEYYFYKSVYLHLAGILKSNGHEYDICIERLDQDIQSKIKEFQPNITLISASSFDKYWVKNITKRIKKYSSTIVILGGLLPSLEPEILKLKSIDFICIGEGFAALPELIEAISKEKGYKNIKNIYYKKGNQIIKNKIRPFLDDINKLPLPDYSLYTKYDKYVTFTPIYTSWDCPYQCSFCFHHSVRKMYKTKNWKYRRKSPDRVIKEIECASKYINIKRVHFLDDVFTLNKDWVLEFTKNYKKKYSFPYYIATRADLLDEDIVIALSESKCKGVAIGVESGNTFIRNTILKKDLTDAVILNSVILLRKHGLKIKNFYMCGIPGETIQQCYQTLTLSRQIKPDTGWAVILKFFPNLEITEYLKKLNYVNQAVFSREVEKQGYYEPNSKRMKRFSLLFLLLSKIWLPKKVVEVLISLPFDKLYHLSHMIIFGHETMSYYNMTASERFNFIKEYLKIFFKRLMKNTTYKFTPY